jgi:hypothetical protein
MSVNNTKYGSSSLNNNSGSNNTAIGAYAAYNNLDGFNNTAIGSNSSYFNTTGANNTALGAGSLCNNTTGSLNTAVGSSALEGVSIGDQNVAVGAQALYVNSGNLNTAIGTYAAENVNSSYNTFLGANTSFDNINATYEYSTAIGYNAKVTSTNQIMMGGTGPNQSAPDVIIPGNAYLPTFDILTATEDQIVPKSYVDTVSNGLNPKAPCNCVATSDVTITPPIIDVTQTFASLYIIDGYQTNVGNRVLINNQTPDSPLDPSSANPYASILNGIYVVTQVDPTPTYSWVRSTDMPNGSDALGAFCFIEFGLTYKATSWIQQTINSPASTPVLVGTNSLYFIKYGGLAFKIGRGLDIFSTSTLAYLEVDTSLNFINYLDSNPNAVQPGGATGGSGILNIGTSGTTNVIIGATGPTFGNPVQFPSGLTGPTGSFQNITVSGPARVNGLLTASGGITGPTGSFTYLSASQQISAPAGITGATGSFTNLNAGGKSTVSYTTNLLVTDATTAPGPMTIGSTGASPTTTNQKAGSMVLAHNNTPSGSSSGSSSILFPSTNTGTQDFGYIQYFDNIPYPNTTLHTNNEIGLMLIGIENDASSQYGPDRISLYSSQGLGNIGINTIYPRYTLDVSGNARFIGGITGATGSFTHLSASQQISAPAGITGATGSFTYLYSANTVTPSDYRIKENVTPLNDTYVVDELIPVTYTNKLTEKQDIGLIAHELQEVFPFLVNGEKDGKDYQSVNYTSLIPLLIKEVKELKEKVKSIEEKLTK